MSRVWFRHGAFRRVDDFGRATSALVRTALALLSLPFCWLPSYTSPKTMASMNRPSFGAPTFFQKLPFRRSTTY
jgi:hypothetical protein